MSWEVPPDRLYIRFRRFIIVGIHLLLVPAAYAIAFLLRFDGVPSPTYTEMFWKTVPVLMAIRMVTFIPFRLFNGWWRHVGMFDLQALVKATSLGSVVFAAYLYAGGYIPGFPRSVLLLEWGVALGLVGGVRFGVRWFREMGYGRRWAISGRRAIIVGAGDAAVHLVRQFRQEGTHAIDPVGLVDDDPNKASLQLHGVPVLGTLRDLEALVHQHSISLVILAIPGAPEEVRRSIVQRCAGLRVEVRVVPGLHELLEGRAQLDELRSVDPQDLLGRTPVDTDLALVREDISGCVVLVTGGAGSIGMELARQIAAFGPEQLVLLDQAETPLFFADNELRRDHPELDIASVVGSVCDSTALERVFEEYRPQYVYHAAAYKHVPLMEANVGEAVQTNVFGTARTAELAALYGARRFVLVSTDKAVHPSSVMGATKRIAERIVLETPEFRAAETDFRVVRFGNVLGSSGSVIPLFRRQIAEGGPITVTHPRVTRYFMTIPEAVHLVLQAASLREAAGRTLMLEMGEPVRILDMAENLIRLSGLRPHEDINIVFTGLRPGEKLHEELVDGSEETRATSITRIRMVGRDDWVVGAVAQGLTRLRAALERRDRDELLLGLEELVPAAAPQLRRRFREAAVRQRSAFGAIARLQRIDEPVAGPQPEGKFK